MAARREREAERRMAEGKARSARRADDAMSDMARLGGRKVDELESDRTRGAGSPLGYGARRKEGENESWRRRSTKAEKWLA